MAKTSKKLTQSHKDAIGRANKIAKKGKPRGGNPNNWKHSEKTKEKLRLLKNSLGKHWKVKDTSKMHHDSWNKGTKGLYKTSNITKEKQRQIKLKNPTRYWLGKKREDISGEKSHCWKGGISKEEYTTEWTETLRQSIRERDGFVCKVCGKKQSELIGMHKKLPVHHIDYNKKNLDPKNLITLCISCHTKTGHNRGNWINYFKNTLTNSPNLKALNKKHMKLREIVNGLEALNNLAEQKLPILVSFNIGLFIKNISDTIKTYEEKRNELIKELGTVNKDAEGKETGKFDFTKENAVVFNEKINAVLDAEVDVKVPEIKLSDLSDLKIEPKNLIQLGFILKE